MSNVFSEEDKKFIIDNYLSMDTNEMARKLGYTAKQIRGYANNNGISDGNYNTRHPKWKTDYILEWYNKKPIKDIANYVEMTTKQVNDYGYRHVGKLDSYSVDDTFFEHIDTEEKAYWLGFLYADGCVLDYRNKPKSNFKCLTMSLAEHDEGHMYKMNESMTSNYPIKHGTSNGYGYYKVSICNTKICDDLIKLGCVPRKSLILKFPSIDVVPNNLVHHFIRGYFDGDGCISHHSENAKTKAYIFGFVGTKHMIDEIQEILHSELGLTKTKQQPCGKAIQTQWGGRENCRKFYEYAYKDATIWLDRKHDKFNKIINKEV